MIFKNQLQAFTEAELLRKQIREEFLKTMKETVVISDSLRGFIESKFDNCLLRVADIVREKSYWDLSTTDFYKEYHEVKSELDKLNIFSDKFLSMLMVHFYKLTTSFQPKFQE